MRWVVSVCFYADACVPRCGAVCVCVQEYFHGCLKGRYWADTRTCQDIILTHGDLFRFYEIGFRCCKNSTTVSL